MKDYEQKHKEDLEEAKSWLAIAKENNDKIAIQILEKFFPELKKSEEEMIRETILSTIKSQGFISDEETLQKCVAWLEKQGNIDKASYDLAEKEKREFVGDGFIKCYADFQDFKEGETYWLEYLGNDNYNVRSDNLLGKTYHITPCQLYTIFKKQTWLEKQGESKFKQCIQEGDKIVTNEDGTHFNVSQLERVSQKVTETEESAKKFLKSAEIMDENGKLADEYRLEKQDEQKPNDEDTIQSYSFYSYKGEPDFKVGDWIINPKTGNILQIKNVLLCGNKGNYEFGNNSMPIESVDRYYKRWTIQDAKDGDVLVASDGSIFIFKEVVDCGCKHYIALEKDNETINVNDNLEHFWESVRGVKPATKEQGDLLFFKMKEAGYMWDVEKKELKKISQEYPLTPNECCKPAWSEEDENMLQKAISTIRYALLIPADKEDDPCFAGSSTIDWLKSLKERYTWKASDEQMDALESAVSSLQSTALESLYQNLKRLYIETENWTSLKDWRTIKHRKENKL